MGGGRSCLQDTKDSGNIFANKRKLNLRPRMASFGRPTITKSPKRETNWKESLYVFCVSSSRKSGAECRRLCGYFFFSANSCDFPPFPHFPFSPSTLCHPEMRFSPLFCLPFSQLSCCRHPLENAILTRSRLKFYWARARIAVSHIVFWPFPVI